MQSINAEYDRLFADLSKVNKSDSQSYTYEENEQFKAAVYFTAALLGYISLFIVGGYILLVEKTEWLKKCVVKAVVLMLLYSLLSTVIGLIPQVFSYGSGEDVESSRVVPMEHLCAVKVWWSSK